MRSIPLPFRSVGLIAGVLLIANASAQTSTWIAPISTTPRSWSDSANWDNGVPNSSTAIAVIGASTGGRGPLIDSVVEIDTLRFGDDPASAGVRSVIIGGNYGAGLKTGNLTVTGAGAFGPSFGEIDVSSGSLTFANDAKAEVRLSAVSDLSFFPSPQVVFADRSAAFGRIGVGSGRASGTVTFRDESTMQGSRIDIGSSISNSTIVFRDHARVVEGTITNPALAPSANSVVIRDSADTSGLAIDARAGTIVLNIENAASAVRVRSLTGRVDVQLGHNDLVLTDVPAWSTSSLNGKISGSGGLRFLASNVGEIGIMNPNNDYTGLTTVGSTVALRSGGRLNNVRVAGGRLIIDSLGMVHGDLDVQGGSVSLVRISRYVSSLHVTGNYSQDSASSLTLSLPTILNVSVDGDAVLAGSLQLNNPFTTSVGTQRRGFLVARSVVGKFDSVYGLLNTAMLRSRIDYGATDAALLIEQQPFAKVDGHTRAAAAFGAHLDATLPSATGSYYSLLASLNSFVLTADVRAALDALAPDRYSAMPDQAFADAAARETTLARQFAHGSSLFFEGRHAQRKVNAVDGLPRTESSIDGGVAGGAWRRGALTLGAFVAHQNGRIDLDDAGSRASVRSTTPGVHGRIEAGEFHFDATASVTRHNYKLRRRILYPGFDRTATASPAAREIDLALTATRVFRRDRWLLATEAGFLGSEWKANDFTETNADAAAMQLSGWRNRSLRSRLGFEIAPTWSTAKLQPRVAVRWLHEFETARPLRTRLASAGGDYFLAPGRRADADEIQLDAGLDWRITRLLVVHANLGVTAGQHRVTASDFSAGLRWQL